MGKSKKAKGVLQVLNNDTPHGFSRAIACELGYDEAIVIQQIHYTATNERDGRLWAYNTSKDWQEKHFPFWSESKVKRVFSRLESLGVVLKTARYNHFGFDRTLWYAIDYGRLAELVGELNTGTAAGCKADSAAAGG